MRFSQRLVRLHLLLPEIATRRDLDDPATVNVVAETVGNETTLELLRAYWLRPTGRPPGRQRGRRGRPTSSTSWSSERVPSWPGRPVPAGRTVPFRRAASVDGMPGGSRCSRRTSASCVVVAADRPGLVQRRHGGPGPARDRGARGRAFTANAATPWRSSSSTYPSMPTRGGSGSCGDIKGARRKALQRRRSPGPPASRPVAARRWRCRALKCG